MHGCKCKRVRERERESKKFNLLYTPPAGLFSDIICQSYNSLSSIYKNNDLKKPKFPLKILMKRSRDQEIYVTKLPQFLFKIPMLPRTYVNHSILIK